MDFFQITKKDQKGQARLGVIHTAHGEVRTPAYLPIGTKGSVRAVTAEELRFWGADMILANTYHLWLRPGDELIQKAGGLHKFIGWDGPIFTDSGGFQVFSLGEKRHNSKNSDLRPDILEPNNFPPSFNSSPPVSASPADGGEERRGGEEKRRGYSIQHDMPIPLLKKISEKGVEFQNELDGTMHLLTPEVSIQIQSNLGSDIALVLDDVPGLPATEARLKKSLDLTSLWAKRAKAHFEKIRKSSSNPGQRLYGIVQGGASETLRKKSVQALRDIGFDGYAIGGLAVGEDPKTMYRVLKFTVPHLEDNKPRHLLGVGYPEQILKAVSLGVDTFDCVLPTRNARHGQLFINKKGGGYELINIGQKQYTEDFTPVDNTCSCYGCTHHNRAYLRHLFAAKEPLAVRLATMHNLRFYLDLVAQIRRAIEYDSLPEMMASYHHTPRHS